MINLTIVSVGKVAVFWRFFGIWGGTMHPMTLVIETFFKFEGQGYKLVQTRKKSIHWFPSQGGVTFFIFRPQKHHSNVVKVTDFLKCILKAFSLAQIRQTQYGQKGTDVNFYHSTLPNTFRPQATRKKELKSPPSHINLPDENLVHCTGEGKSKLRAKGT